MTERAPAAGQKLAAKKPIAKKAPAKAEVTQKENPERAWPWVTIVALVVGIVAAIVWWRIDFTQSISLGSNSAVLNYEFADAWWAGMIAGLAAFAFTWAILPRNDNTEKE